MILYQLGNFNFDPNNLIQSLYQVGGSITKYIVIFLEVILIVAIIGALLYWFVLRKQKFRIPVRMYELVNGEVKYSKNENAGFISTSGGAQVFKLMPTITKWRQPYLIQPKLDHFDTTLGGKRFIRYVRLGRDLYLPFNYKFDLQQRAKILLYEDIDLSSLENQLTANYVKFRGEKWWDKWGNTVITIGFAIMLGFFMLLIAKEMTQLGFALGDASAQIAEALNNFNKEVLQ